MWTINAKSGATVTNGYSPALDLSAYENTDGSRGSVLEVGWRLLYNAGTLANVYLQHSADGSTYATLWDMGALSTTDSKRTFYSWDGFFRVKYDYTVGTSTEDAGFRLALDILPYGLPDWDSAYPCRWEHCIAILPSWFDIADSFPPSYPAQRAAAKRDLELMLKGRGIDASTLYTDANIQEPVPIGLAVAGARRTLHYMLQDGSVVRGELWRDEMERNDKAFAEAFEAACSSGLMRADTAQSGSPSDSSPVSYSLRVTR